MYGASSLHGPHQVAKKFRYTGFPRSDARVSDDPPAVGSVQFGAGRPSFACELAAAPPLHADSSTTLAVSGIRHGLKIELHLLEQIFNALEALLIAHEAKFPKPKFPAIDRLLEVAQPRLDRSTRSVECWIGSD